MKSNDKGHQNLIPHIHQDQQWMCTIIAILLLIIIIVNNFSSIALVKLCLKQRYYQPSIILSVSLAFRKISDLFSRNLHVFSFTLLFHPTLHNLFCGK